MGSSSPGWSEDISNGDGHLSWTQRSPEHKETTQAVQPQPPLALRGPRCLISCHAVPLLVIKGVLSCWQPTGLSSPSWASRLVPSELKRAAPASAVCRCCQSDGWCGVRGHSWSPVTCLTEGLWQIVVQESRLPVTRKPQPGDSEKRYCLLVDRSWTRDSDTPRNCNESFEPCSSFLAYLCPLTFCSEGAQTQPQRLRPSWAGRTLVVGKNLGLDHLRSKQHRNPFWRTSISVGWAAIRCRLPWSNWKVVS